MSVIPIQSATDTARALTADAPSLRLESPGASPGAATGAPDDVTFGGLLADAVAGASHADQVASAKVQQLAAGTLDDLHGTMIASKEAEISLKLVGSIRNKLIDAFHELWRTSV